MDVKRGDIIFFNNKSLLSRTIRLVQTGKFLTDSPSHVAIIEDVIVNEYFLDKLPEIILIEAQGLKVRKYLLSSYKKQKLWYGRLKEEISKEDMDKLIKWFNSKVGSRYDWTALIGIFARGFFRLLGEGVYNKSRYVRNFLNGRNRFFCSELISMGFLTIGIKLWHHPPEQTTPFDLWRSSLLQVAR